MKRLTHTSAIMLALTGVAAPDASAAIDAPLSHDQLGPQLTSDPAGGSYDAALYISAINPNFPEPLEGAPNNFVWTGSTKAAGNLFFGGGAAISILESYLPGTGPNGGDVIQLNIFTNDSSPLVPIDANVNGREPDTLQFHVGDGQLFDPIDTDTPQTILSSGFAVFQDGAQFGPTLALISMENVGGVGYFDQGGGSIAGLGVDEVAMFWEVTPEPGSLSLLAFGAAWMLRRRRGEA